jgi:hypothetical protein
MPIVSDSQRKNAFAHRLKDKRERSSGDPVGMTPDEMRIAEKHYRDVSVWLFNLSVAIRYFSIYRLPSGIRHRNKPRR